MGFLGGFSECPSLYVRAAAGPAIDLPFALGSDTGHDPGQCQGQERASWRDITAAYLGMYHSFFTSSIIDNFNFFAVANMLQLSAATMMVPNTPPSAS
jgi:hypothetical protein